VLWAGPVRIAGFLLPGENRVAQAGGLTPAKAALDFLLSPRTSNANPF